jgi:hypothetical protein
VSYLFAASSTGGIASTLRLIVKIVQLLISDGELSGKI